MKTYAIRWFNAKNRRFTQSVRTETLAKKIRLTAPRKRKEKNSGLAVIVKDGTGGAFDEELSAILAELNVEDKKDENKEGEEESSSLEVISAELHIMENASEMAQAIAIESVLLEEDVRPQPKSREEVYYEAVQCDDCKQYRFSAEIDLSKLPPAGNTCNEWSFQCDDCCDYCLCTVKEEIRKHGQVDDDCDCPDWKERKEEWLKEFKSKRVVEVSSSSSSSSSIVSSSSSSSSSSSQTTTARGRQIRRTQPFGE